MKIFLANLRKYNEGQLIGAWLELPAKDSEIQEVLRNIDVTDEDLEYFIFDYECEFPGTFIKKYSDIDELNYIAEELYDMDEEEIKICSTIMKNENCTLDKAIDEKDNRLIINLNSSESNIDVNLALSYIDQIYGDVINIDKETLARYFDLKKFGEDLKENFNIDEDETIAVRNV